MRTGRIKLDGHSYYHVMSRLVAGTPRMGAVEKEQMRLLMRAYEIFCGVHVLTYAVMGTHFHILLEVPERRTVDEAEIVNRMRAIYTPRQVHDRLTQWQVWRQEGNETAVQNDLEDLRARMYDVSQFMKTFKQRYTQWYNRHTERRGTLWEDRFKSILVEGSENALSTIAAYIDLNPVRGGLVVDPKDYRWCGYAESVGGEAKAREGFLRLSSVWMGDAVSWDEAQKSFRMYLFHRGQSPDNDSNLNSPRLGLAQEMVQKVFSRGGKLSRFELLRCKVRYFSDGVAIGSRTFVNDVFERNRNHFGPRRIEGAKALRFGAWGGLYGARDLRLDPIIPAVRSG